MAIINGTAGDDLIVGGSGGNTLTGGLGRDIFQLSGIVLPTTPNVITDFNSLDDTIQVDLPIGSQNSELLTVQSGQDAILSFRGTQLAVIKNTLVSALSDIVVVVSSEAPTNRPPTGTPTTTLNSTLQNTEVTIAASALLAGFSDPDAGSTLTVTNLVASNGTVVDNNDGTFTVIPTRNFSGVINLTYGVSDGIANLVGQTRSFTVQSPLLAPVANNSGLLQLSQSGGSTTSLLFNKISRQTNSRNELGVFTVDDHNGTINGIAPGQSGYLTAALNRSQVVFSSLSNNAIDAALDGRSTRTLDLPSNSKLGFYLVTNGTSDDPTNSENVVFSFPASINGFQNAQITQPGGITQIAFEETRDGGDRDFNDLVVQIQTAVSPGPIGITQQSSREIFDLTALALTTSTQVTFEVKRDAFFNNHIGFYQIEDAQGTIKVGNLLIKPGEEGYRRAALENRIAGIDLVGTNRQTLTRNGTLQGGVLYAPLLIVDAGTANTDFSNVYTAYSLGNADRADHIRLLADNTFGFEDLVGGGDRDFNDLIVKTTFQIDPLSI